MDIENEPSGSGLREIPFTSTPAQGLSPRSLRLNCLVFGEDRTRIFPVHIEETDSVGDLKNSIKDELRLNFASRTLDLWRVSIADDVDFDNKVNYAVKNEQSLDPML